MSDMLLELQIFLSNLHNKTQFLLVGVVVKLLKILTLDFHGGFLGGGGFGPVDALAGAVAGGLHPVAVPQTTQTQQLKDVSRVRSVFPETWLWTNATIGYIFYL